MKKIVILTAAILTVSIILAAGAALKASAAGNAEYLSGKKQDMIWSLAKADIMPYARDFAARITIPRLNKNTIVFTEAFRRGGNEGYPFWVSGTNFPGTKGISLITGQNSSSFSFLRLLQDGDVISLETTEGKTMRFAVDSVMVTEEKTVNVSDAADQKILMLVTRYEFANWQTESDMRLVVVAREVEDTV